MQGRHGPIEVTAEIKGVGGLEVGAGPVGGGEVEQAQPGEKLVGLAKIPELEMGFGNFKLGGLGQHLIMLGTFRGEFERGVDHAVKTGEGQLVGAEGPVGAAHFKQGVRHARVGGIILQKPLVDGGGLGERALLAIKPGQADECAGEVILVRPPRGHDLPEGDFSGGPVAVFRQPGAERLQADNFLVAVMDGISRACRLGGAAGPAGFVRRAGLAGGQGFAGGKRQ